MTSRRKSRKRKSATTVDNHRFKVALAALFLLGFLIGSLLLLSKLSEYYRPASEPTGTTVPAVTQNFDRLRPTIEDALVRSGVSPAPPPTGGTGTPLRFEVAGEFPDVERLAGLERRLAALSARLRLDERPEAGELLITWDGDLRYLLRFQSPESFLPPTERSGGPRLAIIMDDLGHDMTTARELLRVDLPVTFSILPNTAQASRVATLAHRRGREVLIHLPMEPKGYPETNPGSDALLVDLAPEEIRRRVRGYLDIIPYAVGGNNHMGSRFTESRRGMAEVLGVMKEEGLFFVDSLTSGGSVAFAEARRTGIPAAVRDVFLDNEREVEEISRQIRALTDLAVRRGQAVGICHPYPETLEALRRAAPYLTQGEVTVVPVSRLLVR